jgi:Domain of unknown function (DUF4189)
MSKKASLWIIFVICTGSYFFPAIVATAQNVAVQCIDQCRSKCYRIPGNYCYSGCAASCPLTTPQNPASFYGAVYANNDGSGTYGIGFHYRNQYDATSAARQNCLARKGPCQLAAVFVNRCAAIVYALRGDAIASILVANEPSRAAARTTALQGCQAKEPGSRCEMQNSFCAWDSPN